MAAARLRRRQTQPRVRSASLTDMSLAPSVRLLAKLRQKDLKGYVVASLWRYLLLTEIARSAAAEIANKPVGPLPGTPEWELLSYMNDPNKGMDAEFAVRLERTVDALSGLSMSSRVEADRNLVNEALHDNYLVETEHSSERYSPHASVSRCLSIISIRTGTARAISVALSHWLLGLLTAVDRLSHDFAKKDTWRQPVTTTMAVFLRSDIYAHVAEVAREPDKIPLVALKWEDGSQLLKVVEERFVAATGGKADVSELWTRFFAPTIDGTTTPSHLLSHVLSRPRDLLYLCNASILAAVNAGRNQARGLTWMALKALSIRSGCSQGRKRNQSRRDGVGSLSVRRHEFRNERRGSTRGHRRRWD